MKMLFDKDFLSELNINCDNFLQAISKNVDYVGFVAGLTVDGENVQFVHNSYAEYFVALYFSENLENIHRFEKILFHKKYTNVRFFFDCLLANGSPPHIAVLNRNLETLTKCEDRLRECKDKGGRNLLHLAASWRKRYPRYAVCKMTDGAYGIGLGEYDLTVKTPKNDFKMLEYLLEKCDVVELDSLFNKNCLSYAEKSECLLNLIIIENYKNTRYLCSKDEKFICNILLYSSLYGYKGILETYYNINNYNIKTLYDQTLLHVACRKGHSEIVHFLIKSGLDVNAKDVNKYTPLHYVAQYGYDNIAEKLIFNGAIIDARTNTNKTPFDIALKYHHYNVGKMLGKCQKNKKFLYGDDRTPLHIAAENGNYRNVVSEIRKLGRHKVNGIDLYGTTPLYLASFNGHKEIVQYLINSGATIDLFNKMGSTSRHIACQKGHPNIPEILNDSRTAVDLSNKTPQYAVCQDNYLNITQMLTSSGGRTTIHLANKNCFTPLQAACQNGHQDVVQLLINSRAKVNLADEDGFTPLHAACQNGHQDVVQLLISSGATVNIADNYGFTPLHVACQNGHQNVMQLLINFGATVNKADKNGFTPLQAAYQNRDRDVSQLLINSRATLSLFNKISLLPFYIICENVHQDIAELLLVSGAKVNVSDKDGFTPLYVTCQYGQQHFVKLLFNSGAKANLANEE